MRQGGWHGALLCLRGMYRSSFVFCALLLSSQLAAANDLKQFYELALTRDTTLQAAHFQRDALVEARPQAIAQWLPQISANASATREKAGFNSGPALGSQAADCAISSTRDHAALLRHGSQLGIEPVANPVELPVVQPSQGSEFPGRRGGGQFPGCAAESLAAGGAGLFRHPLRRRSASHQRRRARCVQHPAQSSQVARADRRRPAQRRGPGAGFLRCDGTARHRRAQCAGRRQSCV